MKKLFILPCALLLSFAVDARTGRTTVPVEKVRTTFAKACGAACGSRMGQVASVLPRVSQALLNVGVLANKTQGAEPYLQKASQALPAVAVKSRRDTSVIIGALKSFVSEKWDSAGSKNLSAFLKMATQTGSLVAAAQSVGLNPVAIRKACR